MIQSQSSAEENQILGAVDGDSIPLHRFEEGPQQPAVVDRPWELLAYVDSDARHALLLEADPDLIADSRCGLRVPVDARPWEPVQFRSVGFDELFLARWGHGYDRLRAAARHLRRDFPAGQN